MCGKELELAMQIFFICAHALRFMRQNQIFANLKKKPNEHQAYIPFLQILSDLLLKNKPLSALNCIFSIHIPISSCLVPRLVIPDICHERHKYVRVNFFWPVYIFTDLTRKIGIFDRFYAKKWRFFLQI